MNGDLFNDLVAALEAVQTTFRSPQTFPSQTKPLLVAALKQGASLKTAFPKPNSDELDALVELESNTLTFQKELLSYGKNLVHARKKFVDDVLTPFWIALNRGCADNPKYAVWLTRLDGYKTLQRMVGL